MCAEYGLKYLENGYKKQSNISTQTPKKVAMTGSTVKLLISQQLSLLIQQKT